MTSSLSYHDCLRRLSKYSVLPTMATYWALKRSYGDEDMCASVYVERLEMMLLIYDGWKVEGE